MHRAKHRAAGRASAEVLAATLIERFAVDARSSSTRHATAALPPRGAVAVLDEEPAEVSDTARPVRSGPVRCRAPDRVVPRGDRRRRAGHARAAAPLFRADEQPDDRSPFGAARHAACRRPAPSVPDVKHPVKHSKLRSQPVGAALTVTVLGAAAAVTAVVSPAAVRRVDRRAAAGAEGRTRCPRPRPWPRHPRSPHPRRNSRRCRSPSWSTASPRRCRRSLRDREAVHHRRQPDPDGVGCGHAQGGHDERARQARQALPLGRRGPERLRLLRAGQVVVRAGGAVAAAHRPRPRRASAHRSRGPTCSRATWCSSTRRSATSGSTSATTRSCTPRTAASPSRSPTWAG